ncbi:MAG: hypothetical protein SAMD01599839_08150 [Rectinema sp.]
MSEQFDTVGAKRTEIDPPLLYRLAQKFNGEIVLQGYFGFGNGEWREMATAVLDAQGKEIQPKILKEEEGAMEGWYYLHQNGDLIYRRELGDTAADIRESPFAKGLWPVPTNRGGAWNLLIEALSAGARKERILELAEKWKCTNDDALVYAEYYDVLLSMDGTAFCATRKDFINLQESPAGFGDSYLEAMADLCKQLGYKPSKVWGNNGFASLLK